MCLSLRLVIFVWVTGGISPALVGVAGQEVPKLTLQLSEEIAFAGQAAGPTVNPIRCDSKGAIYFRLYTPRVFSAPIVRYSLDGKQKTTFSTEGTKDWQGADILDFAIGNDGRVHLLVTRLLRKERKVEFGIMVFNEGGKHQETIPIKIPAESVDHIAAFTTGEYLISGYRKIETEEGKESTPPEGQDNRPHVEPVTAIVDRGGTLIADVKLPSASEKGDDTTPVPLDSIAPGAIEGGMTTMGEDGNLYLMLRGTKPVIYVITATGIVARVLKVPPPSEKATALGLTIAKSVGVMVKFAEKGEGAPFPTEKTVFSIINPQTGERLYDYQAERRLGPALACYTPSGLLFLGNVKGELGILRAQPR